MKKELDKKSPLVDELNMRRNTIFLVTLILLALSGCKKEGDRPGPEAANKLVQPVKIEAYAKNSLIGHALIGYIDGKLSDIRFYDSSEKLILMLMPEIDSAINRVNWTLLSRGFTATYNYRDDGLDRITFDGDPIFSIIRIVGDSMHNIKRMIAVKAGNEESDQEDFPTESLEIENEFISGNRITASAIFRIDDYDAPAGYLIYHYNDLGNLHAIEYKNPLMKKHDEYKILFKYSGIGETDRDKMQQIERTMLLPTPVIFEWILD